MLRFRFEVESISIDDRVELFILVLYFDVIIIVDCIFKILVLKLAV